MESKQNRLCSALLAKYNAEKLDAIARLEVYLNNPVAIGEHPQFTEEMDNLIEQYTNANDKSDALLRMMSELHHSK